ncbi:MAG: nucleotidyltransferase family protein [bacterium]
MNTHEIVTFLKEHKTELQEKFGATRIGLAGSYARGDATEESDIDIVVELQSANKFRSFFYLLYFLQDAFGKRVDLVTESSLKPLVREAVLKDIVYV